MRTHRYPRPVVCSPQPRPSGQSFTLDQCVLKPVFTKKIMRDLLENNIHALHWAILILANFHIVDHAGSVILTRTDAPKVLRWNGTLYRWGLSQRMERDAQATLMKYAGQLSDIANNNTPHWFRLVDSPGYHLDSKLPAKRIT